MQPIGFFTQYALCFFALGERGKECGLSFHLPFTTVVFGKAAVRESPVCRWPLPQTSLLICWKWSRPELHRLVLLADETWVGFSRWSEGEQEEVPCAKFITVKKQLCHIAAAAAGVESADSNVVKPNNFIFEWWFYYGLFPHGSYHHSCL